MIAELIRWLLTKETLQEASAQCLDERCLPCTCHTAHIEFHTVKRYSAHGQLINEMIAEIALEHEFHRKQ